MPRKSIPNRKGWHPDERGGPPRLPKRPYDPYAGLWETNGGQFPGFGEMGTEQELAILKQRWQERNFSEAERNDPKGWKGPGEVMRTHDPSSFYGHIQSPGISREDFMRGVYALGQSPLDIDKIHQLAQQGQSRMRRMGRSSEPGSRRARAAAALSGYRPDLRDKTLPPGSVDAMMGLRQRYWENVAPGRQDPYDDMLSSGNRYYIPRKWDRVSLDYDRNGFREFNQRMTRNRRVSDNSY